MRLSSFCQLQCVVLFAYFSLQADEQESGEISPIGDQCESAYGTSASWLNQKSVICDRCYLREKVKFPTAIHSETFLLFMCFTVFCLLNKLFNFTQKTFFLGVFIVRSQK